MVFPDRPLPRVGACFAAQIALPNLSSPLENMVTIAWVNRTNTKMCGGAFVRGLRAKETYAIEELLKLSRL